MGLIYSNIPELEGTSTEIVLKNLAELEFRLGGMVEQRVAHIKELASAITRDGEEFDVVKSIILSLKADGHADLDNIVDKNQAFVGSVYSRLSLIERVMLCREISHKFPVLNNTNKENLNQLNAVDKVAYLQNSFNDTAFLKFSSILNFPRAFYFDNVIDICESVFSGACKYCILPIETSTDGKLSGFYDMIIKYNFKIKAEFDLFGNDKKKYTRYALLCKDFYDATDVLSPKNKAQYFEFVIGCEDYPTLTDILTAADFCLMALVRIDTINNIYENNKKKSFYSLVFRVDNSDLETFKMFLSIDSSNYLNLGCYYKL